MQLLAWLGLGLLLAGLAGLLIAESRRSARGIAVFKPVASAGFLLLGALGGATLFLLALALSFVGDIGLVRMERPAWFRVGLFAFLAAHLAYAAAFVARGEAWALVALAGAILVLPAILVARWIGVGGARAMRGRDPHREAEPDERNEAKRGEEFGRIKPRPEVVAYMVVISAMVALAVGTREPWLIGAAILFYLSDITVARHRFVKAEPLNRLVGLPMYYGAQLVFAAVAAGLV